MSGFDQRGQRVGKQVNVSGDQYVAGRDVNRVEGDLVQGDKVAGDKVLGDRVAGDKNVYVAVAEELKGLIREVRVGAESGDLDGELALDAEFSLRRAALEAEKEEPDGKKLLDYVDGAKTVMDKATGISKSAVALGTALGAAYAKFRGWL